MTFPQRRRRMSGILGAALIAVLALSSQPAPAQASVATDAESLIVDLVNARRIAAGLVPLRRYHDLAVVSGLRAARLRDRNILSHSAPGDLGSQLRAEHVTWYRYGEAIGYTYKAWASSAARDLVSMWFKSAPHKALLMSRSYNYIGVGLSYRSSNGRTFGSIVMTESPDRNGARAWVTHKHTSGGNDLTWSWSGADLPLQTRTAGLRHFDVQFRSGYGAWQTLRNDWTGRAITVYDQARGRTYGLRVRATDRRGNIGAWSTEVRLTLP